MTVQPGDVFIKDKKTGVLMGGLSSEREISINTGTAVLNSLLRQGYNAVAIDVDRDTASKLMENSIETAFIALHGRLGEDGSIQGLLEIMGIPYTGSGVLASAVAMNKALSKQIFQYHGFTTPDFETVSRDDLAEDSLLNRVKILPPLVVKPGEEGSTIGISIVKKLQELSKAVESALYYSDKILIEKYIKGVEITVGIVNGVSLPAIEIRPKSGFYSFASKYNKGETEYLMPPEIDSSIIKETQRIASNAFEALGCSGAARADFIVSAEGTPFILEINTIPGMTETSLLPMAAKKAGIEFDMLVEKILSSASLKTRLG